MKNQTNKHKNNENMARSSVCLMTTRFNTDCEDCLSALKMQQREFVLKISDGLDWHGKAQVPQRCPPIQELLTQNN
jgi:hypothetical protein